MTRQPTPPQRFAAAVELALSLPTPSQLARRIMSSTPGADNGLRAASYEARVSGSRNPLTQPERGAEQRIAGRERRGERKPDGLDDLITLNRAAVRIIEAVAGLLAECADAGCPDLADYTWEEALHDASLLLEPRHPDPAKAPDHDPRSCSCINLVEGAAAVGRDIHGDILTFHRSTLTLRALHRRYSRRAPTRWEQTELEADQVCEFCAMLRPPRYEPKQGNLRGCRHCEDMRRKAGEYPPLELLELHHQHQAGHVTQTVYRKALSDWFRDVGVRPDVKGCA